MSVDSQQDLVITIDTLDQLFNDPDVNPFSENPLQILGMSGLEYIVRQLQAHRRDWKRMRLLIRLPQEALPQEVMTPAVDVRLVEAIRRYCRTKIEDNRLEIHRIRSRSSVGLGILMVIVLTLIACAYLLFTGPLSATPQVAQLMVGATISLFAWVTLWDPLEAFVFNPIPFQRENRILHRLAEMEVVVQEASIPSQTSHGAAGATEPGVSASTLSDSSV